jgi:hypothetical protein
MRAERLQVLEHRTKYPSIGITNESTRPILLHVDANSDLTEVLINSRPAPSSNYQNLVFPLSEQRIEPMWAYSMNFPLSVEGEPFTISIAYRDAITGSSRLATADFNANSDRPHSCYTTELEP